MSVMLKDFMEAEGLEPGDRLPPERDLAEKLGVPRTALRRMLAEMESAGRILRHVGRGTFIADGVGPVQIGRRLGGSMETAIRTYPAEVFETRIVIEPKIAGLAALRATSFDIEEMQKSIDRSGSAESLVEFERWDAIFHRLVAQAARNGLLFLLYETIHAVRAGDLWGRMKEQSLTSERMGAYILKHQEILQAIKDRNSSSAEQHMLSHITEARANILGPSHRYVD